MSANGGRNETGSAFAALATMNYREFAESLRAEAAARRARAAARRGWTANLMNALNPAPRGLGRLTFAPALAG